MAWTERYMDAASSGGDGTTNATSGANAAWATVAAAISGVGVGPAAAPTRINVKAGTYANTTTNSAFNTAGTTQYPVWWRGYKATPGDQDANNVAVTGTDIPNWTWTTTGLATFSGAHQRISNIDFSGTSNGASGLLFLNAAGLEVYRCRARNTNATANGIACTIGGSASNPYIMASYFSATTTATHCINGRQSYIHGCYIVGGIIGFYGNSTTGSIGVESCILSGQAGDAIQLPTTAGFAHVHNCSIYGPAGHGVNCTGAITGLVMIENCYFEKVDQAGKYAITNSTGTNTNLLRAVANAYYNCTGTVNGLGDSPLIYDNGTLAASGFTNAAGGDFSATTYLKALGFPGLFENVAGYRGYLDLGAVQRQEPAGGGGRQPQLHLLGG